MQWRAGGGGEGRSGKGMGLPLPTLQAPLMLRTWDRGPGHTQSPCARGTPKALFVHSVTSSLTQEHVLSTSCAPGAVPGDRG